ILPAAPEALFPGEATSPAAVASPEAAGARLEDFELETARPAESDGAVGEAGSAPSATTSVPFIASEVARSLAFYAREHPDEAPPEGLVIVAPSDLAGGMERLLADTQSIPVRAADPLAAYRFPAAPAAPDDARSA